MLKFAILKILKDDRGVDLVSLMAEFDQEQILNKLRVMVQASLPEEKKITTGIFKKTEIKLGYSREEIAEALVNGFQNVIQELKEMTVRIR